MFYFHKNKKKQTNIFYVFRLLNKMSSVCEIRLDEQPPILKKDVEPVVIDVVEGEFANEVGK